jgi:hypothetical protein
VAVIVLTGRSTRSHGVPNFPDPRQTATFPSMAARSTRAPPSSSTHTSPAGPTWAPAARRSRRREQGARIRSAYRVIGWLAYCQLQA